MTILYKGATRPPMMKGVPLKALAGIVITLVLLAVITGKILSGALLLILWGILLAVAIIALKLIAEFTQEDAYAFDIWLDKMRYKKYSRNKKIWSSAKASSAQYRDVQE